MRGAAAVAVALFTLGADPLAYSKYHHHLWVEGGCAGLLSVRVHLLARPAEELRHRPVPWTRRPVLHRRFPACVV
jgi:hypothetical protein